MDIRRTGGLERTCGCQHAGRWRVDIGRKLSDSRVERKVLRERCYGIKRKVLRENVCKVKVADRDRFLS